MGEKNGFEKEVSLKKFKMIILWILAISLCNTIYNYEKTNTNFLGPKKKKKIFIRNGLFSLYHR